MTIQMKAIEQYFYVVLFTTMHKVHLDRHMDEILVGNLQMRNFNFN